MTTPLPSRDEINRRALATDHLISDLGRRTANGGLIGIASQTIRMLINLATIAILARLLAPTDFGLVAMALTVTTLVSMFTDLGLSAATVQRRDISQDTVNALFYMSLAAGTTLMLVTCALAPLAAWGFGEDRVLWLIVALAIPIPLAAAAAQHNALLQRGMRWGAMQWSGLAAQLGGALVGVFLAWGTDLGYWSLVAQVWATSFIGLVLAWTVCPWRPGRVTSWNAERSALGFGLNLTGFNLLNYFHRQLDNVLIGWSYGAVELGYYTRAYSLFMIPWSLAFAPIGSAVVPALSRLNSAEERFSQYFSNAVQITYFITAPIALFMVVFSDLITSLLLGPSWSHSAAILRVLSVSMLAQPLNSAGGWLFMSTGRVDRMLRWGAFAVSIIAVGFFMGLPFGAIGVASGYALVIIVAAPFCLIYAASETSVEPRRMFKELLLPIGLAAIAAAFAICIRAFSPIAGEFAPDLLAAAGFLAAYAFGLTATYQRSTRLRSLVTQAVAAWSPR